MLFKRMLSSDVININVDYIFRVIKNPISFLRRMNYKKIDFGQLVVNED